MNITMLNKTKLSVALSLAIGLTGCGESELSGSPNSIFEEKHIQDSLNAPTKVKFHLSGDSANIPGPSFALMDTNDGTLKIPTDSASLSDPRAAMNTMDGWSVSMPIAMQFEGAGLGDRQITEGVIVAQLTDKLTGSPSLKKLLVNGTDYQVSSRASDDQLFIQFANSLEEKSEYIIALTNDLKDVNGDAVGMSTAYAMLVTETDNITTSDIIPTVAAVTKGVNSIFRLLGQSSESIIYSTWFTTQSVGDVVYATKGAVAKGSDPAGANGNYNLVWKGSANPNNVDLSTAYTLSFSDSGIDYATALVADSNFSNYIDPNNESAALLLGAYQNGTPNTVTVSKGTVKLPYFLEKDSTNWNTTPFEAGMPSLAIVSNVLNGDDQDDAAAVAQQLVAAGIDLSKLADDVDEQLKLVGLTLTKADGSQLDAERIITRYNPVPQVKSLEDVPFILFTPTGATGPIELVIYQHGITSAKENAYAFASNIINGSPKDIAIMAIDQPLHGARSLDATRSANADATAFLNLTYLPVGRDNLRQSMIDNLGLRASLTRMQLEGALAGTPLALLDNTATTPPSLFGHSLGGITGFGTVVSANNTLDDANGDALFKFSRIAAANTGGQIANLLLGSNTFGPDIIEQVSTAAPDIDAQTAVSQFAYAAQTVIDTVDPYNMIGELDLNGSSVLNALPVYMQQVKNDDTVPNSVENAPFAGTEPLATKQQLNIVNVTSPAASGTRNFTKFNDVAKHSTVIEFQNDDQTDLPHMTEMHSQLAQFLSGTSTYGVSDQNVLE
ncbi:VolA/Pla-1 family phospholipase [Grimontia marina]|uniref:Extracellular lipase n=1 Tax=Grimontia marina TaxID=646534 RepID=A0A128F3T2_9GAMM|nr:VolA/Pla-1 family phospholipase [Grimontia marina]CZF81448.1 Extracellular lipase precursor [Grimontia marina]